MNKKLLLSLSLLSLGVSTSVYSEHSDDHKSVDHKEKKGHDHSLKTAIKNVRAFWKEDAIKYNQVLDQKLKNWPSYAEWNALRNELNTVLSQLKSISIELEKYDTDPVFKKAQREAMKEVFGDKVDDFKRKAKKAYRESERAVREGARKVKKGAEDLAHKAKQAAADAAQKAADALK